MLTKRIIACLDVDSSSECAIERPRVVKGVQFVELRDAGDPAELARMHAERGADEVVFLDISATHHGRATLLESVRRTARELFVPLTVGGGIRSLDDAAAVFDAGADKVAINSAAISNPQLITSIGTRFGSQAVVVAIDARRRPSTGGTSGEDEDYDVWVSGGRKHAGRTALDWVREAEQRGAGEILLTSMDRDGTREGFDCTLTARVTEAVHIPVIASGGAGSIQHFVDVFRHGRADAALAASIFHFGVHSAAELKAQLACEGIAVRWPC